MNYRIKTTAMEKEQFEENRGDRSSPENWLNFSDLPREKFK